MHAANMATFKTKAAVHENSKPTGLSSHLSSSLAGKDSRMHVNKHQSTGNICARSFSVNRAFKDITQKVLNSSGAAVINQRSSHVGHQVRSNTNSVGTGRSQLDNSKSILSQQMHRGNENSHENVQKNRRTSPSVGSTNQQPSKQVNQVPHKSMTNRNAAGVDQTMKRAVGSFGSQITTGTANSRDMPASIQDLHSNEFRVGINSRISGHQSKDFQHAPIIKSSYGHKSNQNHQNLAILNPH